MRCPRCGQEIVDPDPRYCPKCGFEISKASPPPVHPSEGVASAPVQEQPPNPPARRTVEGGAISAKYYLLTLLAVFGGIVGYRAVKGRNPRVAATIFTIGLLVSLVYLGAGFEVYSHFAGPGGVPDMTITGVNFPNATSVVVTVTNQGTLGDGLESVAINNGTLWLVYGLLNASSPQASTELQKGILIFGLYGYIFANGTDRAAGPAGSGTVGTEGFPPGHADTITIPYAWTPLTSYKFFIATTSTRSNELSTASPV